MNRSLLIAIFALASCGGAPPAGPTGTWALLGVYGDGDCGYRGAVSVTFAVAVDPDTMDIRTDGSGTTVTTAGPCMYNATLSFVAPFRVTYTLCLEQEGTDLSGTGMASDGVCSQALTVTGSVTPTNIGGIP